LCFLRNVATFAKNVKSEYLAKYADMFESFCCYLSCSSQKSKCNSSEIDSL